MRIAVCDDEALFREQLISALERFFGKLEVTCEEYGDGETLLKDYSQGKNWDALFLDIEMPKQNGMEAAAKIRGMGFEGPVIFLTSHTEMAMEGYEVSAFRFLGKPVQEEKLQKALQDLKVQLLEQKKLIICYGGEDVVLGLEEICYIEAMNNSVSIVTTRGEYTIRRKISDLEEELKHMSDTFIRIHRCYLVNLMHVKRHKGKDVYLTGDVALPLSRGMAASFQEQLFLYVKNSAR